MENIKEVEPLFPHTEWNDYITEVNKKVIALDSDREAQYQYIMKEFHKMSGERKWDKEVVVSWYKSQMHIIGKHEMANAFDFMALYTQPVVSRDTFAKLFGDSKYGASDYKDGEDTDGIYCDLKKKWTVEEMRESLGDNYKDVTDEQIQLMLDEIEKLQKERNINV